MAYLPGLQWVESHGRFCGAGVTESSSENSYAKCIRIRLDKSARVKATLEGKAKYRLLKDMFDPHSVVIYQLGRNKKSLRCNMH